MRKSVYSLVLMDDVVAAIDRLAYEQNTSRSNLINQILAERVSYVTPEMRMRDIFDQLEEILSDSCYQIQNQASDSMFSVRSSLQYKYRPTVKYQIELFREPKDIAGRLKVTFRTSSQNFASAVEQFFSYWMQIENAYLLNVHPVGVPSELDGGKFIRGFLELTGDHKLSEEDIANAIGEYIKVLDACLKYYFENITDAEKWKMQMESAYRSYLQSGVYIA